MQADGYLFVELYVVDLAHYVAIFRDALGFRILEEDPDFVKLQSAHATVLLNAASELPSRHPFVGYRARSPRGDGVEIGFVTRDLDGARRAALAIPGCLVSEVTHQEWGMSDFRMLSREGYYLRVTTPDPEA